MLQNPRQAFFDFSAGLKPLKHYGARRPLIRTQLAMFRIAVPSLRQRHMRLQTPRQAFFDFSAGLNPLKHYGARRPPIRTQLAMLRIAVPSLGQRHTGCYKGAARSDHPADLAPRLYFKLQYAMLRNSASGP